MSVSSVTFDRLPGRERGHCSNAQPKGQPSVRVERQDAVSGQSLDRLTPTCLANSSTVSVTSSSSAKRFSPSTVKAACISSVTTKTSDLDKWGSCAPILAGNASNSVPDASKGLVYVADHVRLGEKLALLDRQLLRQPIALKP
jgi:hypothetical protein